VKRKLKYSAAIVLLCVVLFFAYVTSLHLFIDPFFARREAQRLLSAASTSQQLQDAVGPLGMFCTFPDGSWLAIRYCDSHAGGIWSIAVARDSGGIWYQSREHFCGAFSMVRQLQQLSSALGEAADAPSDERSRWIQQLSASPDLQTARQRITSRYFTQRK
jgi:hypothetical protein